MRSINSAFPVNVLKMKKMQRKAHLMPFSNRYINMYSVNTVYILMGTVQCGKLFFKFGRVMCRRVFMPFCTRACVASQMLAVLGVVARSSNSILDFSR